MEPYITNYTKHCIEKSLCDYIQQQDAQKHSSPAAWVDAVSEHLLQWVQTQNLNPETQVVKLNETSSLLVIDVKTQEAAPSVVFYGKIQLDGLGNAPDAKESLQPFQPVLRDGKIYGKGAAKDCYPLHSAVACIKYLQDQKNLNLNVITMVEVTTGSSHPEQILRLINDRISNLRLFITLDGECPDTQSVWVRASSRGSVIANLEVSVLKEGTHFGTSGGIVPSTFRITRSLVSRIENDLTGEIILKELFPTIPEAVRQAARGMAQRISPDNADNLAASILNGTWGPSLEVFGSDGPARVPGARPKTSMKLLLRIPPTLPSEIAKDILKKALEENPPYGASVSVTFPSEALNGHMIDIESDLILKSLDKASQTFFGKELAFSLNASTFPVVSLVSSMQTVPVVLAIGVLAPDSNAHGPNESFDLAHFTKVTCCIVQVLSDLK